MYIYTRKFHISVVIFNIISNVFYQKISFKKLYILLRKKLKQNLNTRVVCSVNLVHYLKILASRALFNSKFF